LQNILSSLQKSYKLIDENNVDGLEIDKLEYGEYYISLLNLLNIFNFTLYRFI